MNIAAERYLYERLPLAGADAPAPRDTIQAMLAAGMIASPKQAWATLTKWADEGAYDYGVSLDLGWRYPNSPAPARLRTP